MQFVTPFNKDGYTFIREAAKEMLSQQVEVDVTPPTPRSRRNDPDTKLLKRKILTRPRAFAHYVLNLPASALTFLPSFIGLYAGHETLFVPHTNSRLPLIHVYCFNVKANDSEKVQRSICEAISQQIGYEMGPGNMEKEGEVSIWDVRDVAPQKTMYCASFQLPSSVAFKKP